MVYFSLEYYGYKKNVLPVSLELEAHTHSTDFAHAPLIGLSPPSKWTFISGGTVKADPGPPCENSNMMGCLMTSYENFCWVLDSNIPIMSHNYLTETWLGKHFIERDFEWK